MMCKLKPVMLFCFLLIICSAFSAKGQGKVSLSGNIKNPKGAMVYLSRYIDNVYQRTDSARLDAKGNFAMALNWKEPGKAKFEHGDEITEMHLVPGDKLNLTLDTKAFDESLKYTGKGALINNFLAQNTINRSKSRKQRSEAPKMKEADFVRFSDSTLAADQAFVTAFFQGKKLTAAEAAFLESQKTRLLYSWAQDRLGFPERHTMYNRLPAPYQPSEEYGDYLKKVKLDNPDALAHSEYFSFLHSYLHDRVSSLRRQRENDSRQSRNEQLFEVLDAEFAPGKVKTSLITYLIKLSRDEKQLEALEPTMPRYLAEAAPWPEQRASLNDAYQISRNIRSGNQAPDFSVTTLDGRTVSLSDFQGKVVYVDLWANWCPGCFTMVPLARKLIEGFEGQEVVFLRVSMDQSETVWKGAVPKHGVEGINAHAAGGMSSELAKKYNVTSLPRYLLIGKDGRLISSYAQHPALVKPQIEAALGIGGSTADKP